MIGHDVVVTVLEVRGDQVRLGIKAPRSVAVHREEIYAELIEQNKAAANPDEQSLEELGQLRPKARDEATAEIEDDVERDDDDDR